MEFHYENRIWGAQDAYADSNLGSDDEETLSFCDLVLCDSTGISVEQEGAFRDSNFESSDHEDFDFNVGQFTSLSYHCAADDLFHDGRLLPLTESGAHIPYGKSNSCYENRLLLYEKLQAWRTDSLERQSSYWTTSSSNNFQASHRKLNYSASEKNFRRINSTITSTKSKSTPHRTSSTSSTAPPLRTKASLKWQRFFSFGIIKPSPMKLDEMRLRQRKPSENGVEKSVLKRSVSSIEEQGQTVVKEEDPRAANIQQKSKAVTQNMRTAQTSRSKGWRMLAPKAMTSLNCLKALFSVI